MARHVRRVESSPSKALRTAKQIWPVWVAGAGVLVLTVVIPIFGRGTGQPRSFSPPRSTFPGSVPAVAQQVTVDRIVDGDTIVVHAVKAGSKGDPLEVTDKATIRLLDVDTPETKDPRRLKRDPKTHQLIPQCWGPEATNETARMLTVGSTAYVDNDEIRIDPNKRYLMYVWNEEGTFVNRSLVAKGLAYAWLYQPENDAWWSDLLAAQNIAKANKAGVWSPHQGTVGPWANCVPPTPHPLPTPKPTKPSVYYPNCTEVHRLRNSPLRKGEPGYRPALDRNNDGIACN